MDDFVKKYGNGRKIKSEYVKDESFSDGFGCGVLATEIKTKNGLLMFICNTENREVEFSVADFSVTEFSVADKSPFWVADHTDGVCFRGEKPQGVLSPFGSVTLFFGDDLFFGNNLNERDYVPVKSRFYSSDGCIFGNGGFIADLKKENGFSVRFGANMLPINVVDFKTEHVDLKNVDLSEIRHNYFYPLNDGENFEVVYRFKAETVPEEAFAAMENAENLDEIIVNGRKIVPNRKRGEEQIFDENCFIDQSFLKTDIAFALKTGDNYIKIKGKKVNNITGAGMHRSVDSRENATEAETAYIIGRFGIRKINGENVMVKENPSDAETYPYYSGEVVAEKTVCIPPAKPNEGVYISLKNGNYASAEVFVNGKSAGKKFVFPAFFDVTEYRGQTVEITVKMKNTLFSLFGPHDILSYEKLKWVEPRVFNDIGLKGEEKTEKFDTGEIVITVVGR